MLEVLILEEDPLIAAFVEDLLLSQNIASDCVSLPGRFDYLLRRSYDVAVIGVSTQSRYTHLAAQVLRRRRIPALLFSTHALTPVDRFFPEFTVIYYDRNCPERLAFEVARLVAD